MRHLFGAAAALALAVCLTFFVLPLVAIFLRVPPGDVYTSEVAVDALVVTARTSLIANLVFLLVGTPAAYLLATRRFPGRALVVTLIELPLVLPPAVAGIGLLVAFGRSGLLGGELEALGVSIPFTEAAVVLAVIFVASPFYIRQAIAAFEAVDRTLIDAARTLGARPWRAFWRIALPLASGGLAAGWALAFARGVGEFGATIIFAGSFQGLTQTLPLAIYSQLEQDLDVALAIGGLLILFSGVLLLAVKVVPSWTRLPFTSTSDFPAGTSASRSTSA
jgi:molybdate transport system permease protein